MQRLLTSDLQERPAGESGDAYMPANAVARNTSCTQNTALISKEAKDLKGPYLLVPGTNTIKPVKSFYFFSCQHTLIRYLEKSYKNVQFRMLCG